MKDGFVRLSGGPLDGHEIYALGDWPRPVHELDPARGDEPPGRIVGHYQAPKAPGEPARYYPKLRAA